MYYLEAVGSGVGYHKPALSPRRFTPEDLNEYFVHDRCMRESGHDTTYRWDTDGNRCADFVTVDLNSLLYKVELDLARTIGQEFEGELKKEDGRISSSQIWKDRARRRRQLIREHLWDPGRSLFFDYHRTTGLRRNYVSATTFYPLWAWNGESRSTSFSRRTKSKLSLMSLLAC